MENFVPYVHNPESAWTILRSQKKLNFILENCIDTLDSPIMEKTQKQQLLQMPRPNERNWDLHAVYLLNSCQGKDAGVLFGLNYSSSEVVQVLDIGGKHSSLHVCSHTLSSGQ